MDCKMDFDRDPFISSSAPSSTRILLRLSMHRRPQKPSVRVRNAVGGGNDRVKQDPIDAEVNAAIRQKHFPHPPGIVLELARKHDKILEKRQEERNRRRAAKFAKLGVPDNRSLQAIEDEEEQQLPASGRECSQANHKDDFSENIVDTLDVVDTSVNTVGVLSNITRSIVLPTSWSGSAPIVEVGDSDSPSSAQHLDDHVEEQLDKGEQRREKLKGVMKGAWTFVKTPVGLIAAIYGFLVIFSGAGLVICLAGWVPGDKDKQVEVFSQATNALFTITGVGLIPWRVRDTYLIARICHYRNLSNKLRRRAKLAPLEDPDDLCFEAGDAAEARTRHLEEEGEEGENLKVTTTASSTSSSRKDLSLPSLSFEDEHMLNPYQSAKLRWCQAEFAKSCTWYRPTETATHRAFPISMAVGITAWTDGNSIFQCLMCGFMWGYATHYKDRPAWSTGTFMPLSFVCGIIAAVLIWQGSKRSKKTTEVKEVLRKAYAAKESNEEQLNSSDQT